MSDEVWVLIGIAAVLFAGMAVVAVVLLVKLVCLRALLRGADIEAGGKVAFWGALLYLLSPVDLLPDPMLLDDIGFLLLALRSLRSSAEASGLLRDRGEPRGAFPPPVGDVQARPAGHRRWSAR
ncbi:YkvA family protein [Streptomyces sp. H27-D2]|uniref:YkvA family protein n=1 Tax=Streptomyces sp. H27-D2 TaxID=3046304 RepID=UPI002DB57681|nr:YkvA family protein [Streptomyces sp. H27-D2]MEC4019379.1 YkvA family protein [Streptomyces sp. H27-D2]